MMDILLFGFIHAIFSIIYWGVIALIALIPAGIIVLIGGYIFAKIMEFLIYMFW